MDIIFAVGMLLGFVVTLLIAGIYKLLKSSDLEDTIEDLARRRFDALKAVLKAPEWSDAIRLGVKPICEKERFEAQLYKFSHMMEGCTDKNVHGYMQNVREEIDKALRMPYYEENREKDDALIDYVQLAAHALTACAPGMKEMHDYGARFVSQNESAPTMFDLVTALDKAVYEYDGLKKDTLAGKVFWSFVHPQKAWASFLGHGKETALDYNSFKHGNANMHVATFKVGNMRMKLNLGPTPTADHLFEAHLLHLKKKKNNQVHFQQDIEFSGAKGENLRRLKKKAMADEHDHLIYVANPLDGMIWKGKEAFHGISCAKDFHKALKTHLDEQLDMPKNSKEDNSFYIPEKVLTQDELFAVINQSEKAFEALESGPYWKALVAVGSEGMKRLNKAQLLGFEAMIAVNIILKIAQRYENADEVIDTFMGQACKQDIDRGVLLNVVTLLYMDALAGNQFTDARVNQIVGIVLARAGMVDGRAMLSNRFEALSTFLHLLSGNFEGFMAEVKALNTANQTVVIETENL